MIDIALKWNKYVSSSVASIYPIFKALKENLYLEHWRKCVLDHRDNFTEKQYQNMELDSKILTILWRGKKPTKKTPSNPSRQHLTNCTVNHMKSNTGDMSWVRRNLPESLCLFLMATKRIKLDLLMKVLLLVHKILPPFYHHSLIHTRSIRHKHAKEIPKHKNQPKRKKPKSKHNKP